MIDFVPAWAGYVIVCVRVDSPDRARAWVWLSRVFSEQWEAAAALAEILTDPPEFFHLQILPLHGAVGPVVGQRHVDTVMERLHHDTAGRRR